MRRIALVLWVLIVPTVFIGACSRGGNTNDGQRETSGMGQMMNDPQMRQMMDQMMKNPNMMRQMMVEMMSRYMAEHPDKMSEHMQAMMNNPECRRAMVEMLRGNPAMREKMRAILADAEKPAAA